MPSHVHEVGAKRMKLSPDQAVSDQAHRMDVMKLWVEDRRSGYVAELTHSFPNFSAPVVLPLLHDSGENKCEALLRQSLDIMQRDPDALVLHTRSTCEPVLPETVQTMRVIFTSLSHTSVWMEWVEKAITQAQKSGDIDNLEFLRTENLETKIQTYSSVATRCMRAYREELKAYSMKEKELGLQVPTPPPLPPPPIMTIAQRILHIKLDQFSLLPKQLILLIVAYGA